MSTLYQQRWRANLARHLKYGRLLFNDHFTLFLVLLGGASVLAYQQLLLLPFDWQAWYWWCGLAIWLIVGWSFGRIATYLLPADRLFIRPENQALRQVYLPNALYWSLLVNSIIQIAWASVLVPLIWQMTQGQWLILIVWWGLAVSGKALILMRQYRHLWHQDALDWPIALQREGKRQQGWWQFYSWFAQIPEQTFIVKRRRYLDWLLALMTAKATPLQRLWLTRWVRSQELFGLYWRITLLVAFLVWLTRLADWWWTPVIGSGGVYLLVVQLIPLYQQTHQILWTRLLPVQQVQRQFQQLLILGLIGPIVLVMLFGHFTWLGTLVLWIVAIGLVFGYVPRLIRR